MVIVLIMFMHLLQPSIGQKGIAVYRKSVANINILSSIVKKMKKITIHLHLVFQVNVTFIAKYRNSVQSVYNPTIDGFRYCTGRQLLQ